MISDSAFGLSALDSVTVAASQAQLGALLGPEDWTGALIGCRSSSTRYNSDRRGGCGQRFALV